MLYEFFYFHDEIELLELKLSEMEGVVDRVILMECEYDLAFKPKPMYYWENRHLFEKYNHKIIHVNCDNIEEQRTNINPFRVRCANCIKGFKDCEPNDIIMYSDPDVIIKHSSYEKVRAANLENHEASIICDWYEYYMDWLLTVEKFLPCSAMLYKNTIDSGWATVHRWRPVGTVIENGGWHFSKMGGVEAILKHIDGYPHRYLDYPSIMPMEEARALIQSRIDAGLSWEGGYPGKKVVEYIPYKPENYPAFLNEHPEIFAKYFRGGMNV